MDCSVMAARDSAPARDVFAWEKATTPVDSDRPAHASLCMTCPMRRQCIGDVAAQAGSHDLLAVLAGRRQLRAGETLALEGEGMFVVRRGSLKAMAGGQARGFHFPGETITAGNGVRLVALEESELCVMRSGARRESRACHDRLWDMSSRELLRERAQAAALEALSPVRRVTVFLANLVVRARVPASRSRELHLHLSATDIAAFLGVPVDTVRRVLAVLAKREVLLPGPRSIVIVDAELLQFAARQG
jgi:CRP-like cAMP-binding protein